MLTDRSNVVTQNKFANVQNVNFHDLALDRYVQFELG